MAEKTNMASSMTLQLVAGQHRPELLNMIMDRLRQLTNRQLFTVLNILREMVPPVHRGPRRRSDASEIINPWAFHVIRENAIRKNVNDMQHPNYDETHVYFGKPVISRRPTDVTVDEWEDDSIMSIMKQIYAANEGADHS